MLDSPIHKRVSPYPYPSSPILFPLIERLGTLLTETRYKPLYHNFRYIYLAIRHNLGAKALGGSDRGLLVNLQARHVMLKRKHKSSRHALIRTVTARIDNIREY